MLAAGVGLAVLGYRITEPLLAAATSTDPSRMKEASASRVPTTAAALGAAVSAAEATATGQCSGGF